MNILERYIWKSIAFSVLVTWASLVMLDAFFAFLGEIGDIGNSSSYGTFEALTYIAYTLPRRLYDFFPTATLIGALMGLGNMAANSELIAMRAAGLSIARIVWMTIKLGFALALLAFVLGEWLAPQMETKADIYKAEMQQKRRNNDAIWVKNGDYIIHVAQQATKDKLTGITVYHIDMEKGELKSIQKAQQATLENGQWQLSQVQVTEPSLAIIKRQQYDTLQAADLIPTDLLAVTSLQPDQLAASELAKFIEHQQGQDLNSARFELAYWTHFTTPLSTIVMLILAAPFVFGTQRNANAGQRIFLGIMLGITFFLLNHIIGTSGVVYGFPPLLAATLPLLLFLLGGLLLLFRTR